MKYAKRFTNYMTFIFKVISLVDAMTKQVFMPKNAISPSHTDFSLFPATIHLKTYKLSKSLIIGLLLLLVGMGSVSAATRFSKATGNWNATSTWAATSGGTAGVSVPIAGDVVTIEGNDNVTVTADAACTSLTFNNTGSTITINSSYTLTVSGAVTLNSANADYSNIITGAGSLTCASLTVGTTASLSNRNRTTTLTTSVANLTISGNLSLYSSYNSNQSNNATFNLSTGTVTVNGSITSANANGNNTSTLSMATGTQDGILILGGATPFALSGTNTITLNGTGATVNYNGAAQTVRATTYSNLTLSGSGVKTTTGATVNGILSMEGTATTTGTVATYGTSATIQYKGSAAQTTGTEFPATFSGLGGVIINNTSGVTLSAAKSTSSLTLTNGILNTNTYLLSVTNTATTAISGGSATSFIKGPVKWTLPSSLVSGSTYNFPVGNTNYLPFSLVNSTTGTGTITAQVQATSGNAGGTFDATLTSISTAEYWSLVTTGNFTNSSVSLTRQTAITPLDEIGGSLTLVGQYTSLGGTTGIKGVSNSNSIGSNRFFVLAKGKPTITVTPLTALNDFSYAFGLGPSSQLRFFTVSGKSLTTNITVLPTDSFEISLTSGTSFVAQSLISLLVNNGTVPTTTIYVRMKAGLAVGNIIPVNKITCTSDYATTQTVTCSGTVTNLPVITTSPTTLSGFNYNFGSGPSAAQSFTVSGVYLTSNIVITAPTDYQICLTSGGTYGSTLTLTQVGGNVGTTTIYVKLTAGLSGASYNENITLTSTNAVTKNVVCSGSVNTPIITLSTVTLAGFIYTTGQGPSEEQTFIVSGKYLTDSIKITPPANFEISTTSGAGFVSAPIIKLNQSGGTVAATTIYVRMKAGLTIGTVVGSIILTSTSTWYLNQNVALSGIVANSATTISSKGILNGFVYTLGNGPSTVQSFTVSGTSLTNDIIVTPPSNFEICLTSGGTYVSTALTIVRSGTKVNAVPVYVRLKAGLSSTTYTGQISLATTGAVTQYVTCNGVVIPVPTITAGPAGLESTCNGASVGLTSTGTGLTNIYWNGPNGFFSTDPNPSLGLVSAANNGTYTVTANALSGVNLLTNGDFELGNTGFGSGYTYVVPSPTALSSGGSGGGEGLYTITDANYKTPLSVHTNWGDCGGHSESVSQMVINGATSPGIIAWSESVSVVPGNDYQFSYFIKTANTSIPRNPAQLQLYINGVPAGQNCIADTTTCLWKQFVYNSNSGSNTVLQLTLTNKNMLPNGNDFALDDIVLQHVFTATSSVNLNVNPILPVSVSITASINPLYSGGSVTFTAAPVNGGTSSTYQWKVNGNNVGTSNSTYTYSPATGDSIRCVMTSNYPCTTGNPATSNTLIVLARSNYWRGTNGTDWGTATNWTAGIIPGPGDDVEYATAANNGNPAINDLILEQDRTIGSLINSTARRLVIPAGKSLIVNNDITTDGNPDRIYIYSSSSAANGTLIFHNPSNLPVQATVEMYSKAWFDLSAAVNNKYHWQYFGIPIRSVVSNPTFYGSYVRIWDETGTTISNHWVQLNNTSTLTSFLGYEICQQAAKTIVFQGQLENGDFNSGQLSVTSTALFQGQHIFANPYTAAIDIRQLTFGTQTEATVYLYNTGTYNDWNTLGGQSTPGNMPGQYTVVPKNTAGSTGIPRQIPSMQGFLVKAMSNSSLATFAISYNSVMMNNSDQQRASAINNTSFSDKVCTMIDVKGSRYADRMWIFSEPTCTRGFDNGWDGVKLLGSPLSPQLFAMEVDGDYQVDAVADMNNTELGFQAGEDVEYTLTFTHENLLTRYAGVYLMDSVENKTVDITESGSTYKFVAESAPTKVNRFKILTRPYEKDAPDSDTKVKLFSSKGTIFVQNISNSNGELSLYDMAGHYIKKVIFGANEVTTVSTNIKPGVYVARALTNGEEITKRLIVW